MSEALTETLTKSAAVSRSLAALIQDDVETAVELSSRYIGGAGSLYERETASLVRIILHDDWSPDPAIKPRVLHPLRVVAAAMELWGEGDLRDFADVSGTWKYSHDPETVTRLLYTAGLEQHRLAHLRDHGVRQVEIRSPMADPASSCRADLGRVFTTETAPILPHPGGECRCTYLGTRAEAPAA